MIEIEIRAKIKNLEKAKKNLTDLGAKFIKKEKQLDKIYGREKDLDKEHKIIEGRFSARVRQKGEKIFVELKEIRRTGAGLEFSSSLTKIEHGAYFLSKLDYNEAFTISKIREVYKLDDFEISLDRVEKLGDFIEIEHHDKSGNDEEKSLNECKKLLTKIDPEVQIETRKYGDLMQELINKTDK